MGRATKAQKLSDDALASFRRSHAQLTQANQLLAEEADLHETLVVHHGNQAAAARSARQTNQGVIDKLTDLVGQ